eukprot:CAMPEP_0119263492 /NCGR_PEP_ID=MMETSP1329-20130426/2873_1 /TAXON_ID=114041 /ORGANISM="Genus nov. species nov., Strain RCC1024" /LENGTH=446 /DNA_ID=CAMNT_0007263199 /DNA_START=383 /DNA_END=1720 /DNA_ORIENTATION=+
MFEPITETVSKVPMLCVFEDTLLISLSCLQSKWLDSQEQNLCKMIKSANPSSHILMSIYIHSYIRARMAYANLHEQGFSKFVYGAWAAVTKISCAVLASFSFDIAVHVICELLEELMALKPLLLKAQLDFPDCLMSNLKGLLLKTIEELQGPQIPSTQKSRGLSTCLHLIVRIGVFKIPLSFETVLFRTLRTPCTYCYKTVHTLLEAHIGCHHVDSCKRVALPLLVSATKINAGVPRAFWCALEDVLNPTPVRLIKVWTSIESAFISSGCHSASVIWSVLTDIVILHVALMGHIITSVEYVEYLCDAAHNCLVDLLLTLLPHEKTLWHWWNTSLEHGPAMCASARVSGRLLEQHILLLLSRFQYIEMTSIPTTNPGLHEIIIGALGSPIFCSDRIFTSKSRLALFEILLTTAQLDRENNKAVLDSVAISKFCPCASSKDACALLEW